MSSITCTVYVTGNTFPHKGGLKALGLKWDGDAKAWVGSVKRNQRFPDDVHVEWRETESERDWRLFVECGALSEALADELFQHGEG